MLSYTCSNWERIESLVEERQLPHLLLFLQAATGKELKVARPRPALGFKPRTLHQVWWLVVVRVVCPRCGRPGSLERYTSAGRAYLRVRHSRRELCYLGPERPVYRRAAPPSLVELAQPSTAQQPPSLPQQLPPSLAGYEDILEALATLYHQARTRASQGDPTGLEEFIVFVERRLSPLVARYYEEARLLLRGNDLYQ